MCSKFYLIQNNCSMGLMFIDDYDNDKKFSKEKKLVILGNSLRYFT
jgi:hypothetical protein